MGQKWIIDVLADLKTFAEGNDLPVLASKLDEVSRVAEAEIEVLAQVTSVKMQGDQSGTRRFFNQAGTSRRIG
jgi:hypothetical protein